MKKTAYLMIGFLTAFLLVGLSGCSLLGTSDRTQYYQALAARDDARAAKEATIRAEMRAEREAQADRMNQILVQLAAMQGADPNVKAMGLLSLASMTSSNHLAEVALAAVGQAANPQREQTIAAPESDSDRLRALGSIVVPFAGPLFNWLQWHDVFKYGDGLGGSNSWTVGDNSPVTLTGSFNKQYSTALGEGATATTTLQPYEVSPEVVKVEPFVVETGNTTTTTTTTNN